MNKILRRFPTFYKATGNRAKKIKKENNKGDCILQAF